MDSLVIKHSTDVAIQFGHEKVTLAISLNTGQILDKFKVTVTLQAKTFDNFLLLLY